MKLLVWVLGHGRVVAQVLGTLLLMGLVVQLWPLLVIAAVLVGLLVLAVGGPHALTRRRPQ